MSENYGYLRVSTADQNEDRQLIAVKEMGVPEVFVVITERRLRGSFPPQNTSSPRP